MAIFAAVLFCVMACADPTEPADVLAGKYSATFWTITKGEEITDALVAGASIALTLDSDGHTAGEMHLPPILSNTGAELNLSLDGQWQLDPDGSHVRFVQQTGTFLPDAIWTAGTTTVATAFSDSSGKVVKVILAREGGDSSDDARRVELRSGPT